jgi:hypothetical protein
VSELNPNHPVTQQVRDHYHVLLLIVLQMQGLSEVEITPADIEAIKGRSIVVDTRGGGLWLRNVDAETAGRIAREAGGLPL